MYLGAHVLLPLGFDEHPEARYPFVIFHGHFPRDVRRLPRGTAGPEPQAGLQRAFPSRGLQPDRAGAGASVLQGLDVAGLPARDRRRDPAREPLLRRLVRRELREPRPVRRRDRVRAHPLPREEIPGDRRGMGAVRLRRLDGRLGGDGRPGLLSRRLQRGWIACPDPIDFRAYTVVNLYEDKNAYRPDAPWKTTPRPGMRNYLGHISATLEEMNRYELVLGTKGRSGDQWDIWQAVYSPVGADGYPKPIWDKRTGVIDRGRRGPLEGALRSHEHPEARLGERAREEARGQAPHLRRRGGQLLSQRRGLPRRGVPQEHEEPGLRRRVVDYEPRAEHCWNGDHTRPNAISRLRYHQMFLPKIVERIRKSAPPGADLKSWDY